MVDLSNVYGGYLKASRYSAIKRTDLEAVYKRYGLNLNAFRGNISDADIRRRAIDAVLKRNKRKPTITIARPKNPTGRGSGTIQPLKPGYSTFR